MSTYHTPVMLHSCIEHLRLQPGGVYVDATLGAGGHTLAMLEACPKIKVYAFDRDADAIQEASQNLKNHPGVECIHAPFSSMRTELALRKVAQVDGVLFDLGVSSHQLDEAARGFSFDKDALLDMRMDDREEMDAAKIVNSFSEWELTHIFKTYGEEKQARRMAKAILHARNKAPITSTLELARVIQSVAGVGSRDALKAKMRVFQALRIAVNQELGELETTLPDAINLLKANGRVLVISYHSLEDRLVKHIFRDLAKGCMCPVEQIICTCALKPKLKVITPSPLCASDEELQQNPRSRSAKLRVAEKLLGDPQ